MSEEIIAVASFADTAISLELQQRFQLLAYYGYNYPGHNTKEYKAATQVMMWESQLGNGTNFRIFTKLNGNGDEIDITNERAEIEALIADHNRQPSFANSSHKMNIGDTLTLTDANHILANYNVVASNNATVTIENNTLKIKPTQLGKQTITFSKKQPYDDSYIVYTKTDYQTMLTAGNIDNQSFSITIDVAGGKVQVSKVDKDTDQNIPQGDASLKGAVYGIYTEQGTLIERVTTNEKGIAQSNALPYLGNYYLQEIIPSNGYLLDETKYYFNISINQVFVNVKVKENVIKREIELLKLYETDNDFLIKEEVGVTFGFYDKHGTLIKTETTDSNGRIRLTLPYGRYIVKQLTTISHFAYAEDFEKVIDENTDVIYYKIIVNKRIKGSITIKKIGEKVVFNKDGFQYEEISLPNVIFEFLADEDIIIYGEEIYHKGDLIKMIETDENGICYIDDLPLGRYILKEITSSLGNQIDKEEHILTITEEDKDISYLLKNYLPKGKLIVTKLDKETHLPIPHTKFEIYTENQKLIFSGYTDEEGKIIINNLYVGKFYIKEVEAAEGYDLESDGIPIEIFEGEITQVPIFNDRLDLVKSEFREIEVPDTKIDDYFIKGFLLLWFLKKIFARL